MKGPVGRWLRSAGDASHSGVLHSRVESNSVLAFRTAQRPKIAVLVAHLAFALARDWGLVRLPPDQRSKSLPEDLPGIEGRTSFTHGAGMASVTINPFPREGRKRADVS